MNATSDLPPLLRAFFCEWAVQQRNLSTHTVRSYRDAWRLFLRFAAKCHRRSVAELTLGELDDKSIIAFLEHSERERQCTIGTRNCRLAALRAFFAFTAAREPAAVAQCAAVLRIPIKRAARPALSYLDANEVEAILAQPDRHTPEGQRDHALFSFLYNTGARIQEALDLCPNAIRFSAPSVVRLFGKGRKERLCPLWPETVQILRALLSRIPRPDDQPLFVNRYGQPLGASGYASSSPDTSPQPLPPFHRSQRKRFLHTRFDTRRLSGLLPWESILRSFEAGSGTPALIQPLAMRKLASRRNVQHWSDWNRSPPR